ncbi:MULTISPECIES: Vi polysaccharide biosynthesis UDP-N-acetylglucosamine C-6 dehydrogenase TviB [Helicobacter]|uniref:Vi polysaccharide biosynthesis UDP-N-acetylglucosamine C-6 dehydrogenase TviB n=1 Tax=Helicobacter TaxID=209 RepID=UPI00202AA161|nr:MULTISPECIES: Vi polysaccharide biosynthesis UDP-N-acetylglucosamine C-6 dehydrogenase TviB [Helicobacter]MCI7048003.1 Vi polysaccharide biosynthesis UDP-N-acetylglucosamine C-6 dehydrogenase TviB [Helicobacter sp.]MCL9821730.1 Vi polysaccharide biosynthesis UDP-N-acetylglucosamine C-6 dehydrogenase TviB [Helicobacter colisuis]MCL9822633.1 Vi polysaccharide biosynthesis UDP-N-acetylglucosamine C-6 dehydrogenase TviB [Helicobacter colisuis]
MKTLAVIGLGYVGLPLAVEFGKKYKVIGFDIHQKRIDELKEGYDRTLEVEKEELQSAKGLSYTTNLEDLRVAQIYIVTVPTPIDHYNKPDLTPLLKASSSVGKVLKKDDIVIYESTVYPGCTEEDCVPILERESGLKFNVDFFCGYSPERINPGDKEHRLPNIKKVTSGSTPQIAQEVNALYASIIAAGTHKASSIKVAEAAKVIENSQRDINIAFVNELSLIFDKMGIDTLDVLEAAGTKWNFLPFRPGLVGGHCIGVDPYYLTHKAESLGYHSQVILAGRHINDNMGVVVANKVIKLMIKQAHQIVGSKVAILGITFKENCPDIRNSRVVDIIKELKDFDCCVEVFDPWADLVEVEHEYGLTLKEIKDFKMQDYAAVIVAVAHNEFKELDFSNKGKTIIYDLKGILPKEQVSGRL